MLVPLLTAAINFIASAAPQIPGLIAEIRGTGNLTADGAALLDRINADQRAIDSLSPLPEPVPPKPTKPD